LANIPDRAERALIKIDFLQLRNTFALRHDQKVTMLYFLGQFVIKLYSRFVGLSSMRLDTHAPTGAVAISLKKELMCLGVEADFPPGHVHFVSNDSALIVNCSRGDKACVYVPYI